MRSFSPGMTPIGLVFALFALIASGAGAPAGATEVPLPRAKPPIKASTEPRSFAEAVAGLDLDTAELSSKPTECDRRLAGLAVVAPLPRLIGPGACGGAEMVELTAVLMPDKRRVALMPAPILRCAMAESVAAWVRDEVAPAAAKLGSPLQSIENYNSYECRGRNRVKGAKLSEHGKGNAIDVRALHLRDGRRIEFTDEKADKPLRTALRESACHRFTTVLGPGDPYHSGHIHLDIIARRGGYRMCQWEVREPAPPLPPKPPEERKPAEVAAVTADRPQADGPQSPPAAAVAGKPAAGKPAEPNPGAGTPATERDPSAPSARAQPARAEIPAAAVPLPASKPAKSAKVRHKRRKSKELFHFPFTLWR